MTPATADTLPIVRIDTLPETTKYPDEGCAVIVGPCTECPLPRCLEDLPSVNEKRVARDADIVRLRKRGVRAGEIASEMKISERSIHRIVKKAK